MAGNHMNEVYHIPAMLQETIEGLSIKPDGVYVDVTFGGGGHSRAIIKRLASPHPSPEGKGEKGRLFSFDQDKDALQNAIDDERWTFVHSNFRYLRNWMDYYGVEQIDGLLADLGVSFHHFDCPERGFSFRFSAPLDMRMNQTAKRTAADIVNGYSEEELAKVLWLYGELKNGRQVAKNICKARAQKPIERTEDLIKAVGAYPQQCSTDGHRQSDRAELFTRTGKGESDAQTTPPFREGKGVGLFCSDIDYATAELIGNKLILHMAAAYRMIKGAEEVSVPKVQALDQRAMLLSLLPTEFETKTLLDEAKSQGISRRTVIYWNDEWQQTGAVQKIRHGVYRKCLACA